MGSLFTLAVIAWVIYMIVKKYYPQAILLLAGLVLLSWAVFVNGAPLLGEKATSGSAVLDIFHTIQSLMSVRVAGLGLTIMSIAGFAKYMDYVGASKSLFAVVASPIKKVKSPYLLLVLCFYISQFLVVFIPSHAGLGLLLMVARRAIADGFVAAGIRGQVAADEAAVGAAGVTGIHEVFRAGQVLDVDGAHAGFNDHVHAFFVDFEDFIHPFQEQYNAVIGRYGAAAYAGAGAARRDRYVVFVGNFHDLGNFFGRASGNDDFRQAPERRCQAFIELVVFQYFSIRLDVFFSDGFLQGSNDFCSYSIILSHSINKSFRIII